MLKLEGLSPSALNRFKKCPMKWRLGKIKPQGVVVPAQARLYGTAVHQCIALYFNKIHDHPAEEDIEMMAKEAFENGLTHAMKGQRAKTKRILDNFIQFEKERLRTWKQYKPTFVEKWMSAKVWSDVPEFRCIVDFYSEPDATAIDWKSGGGEMNEDNMRQGKMNEMILARNSLPVKKVIFFGLQQGVALQVPKVTEGWVYKDAKRMVEMVGSGRFVKRPSGLCGWCESILDCELSDVCLWWDI